MDRSNRVFGYQTTFEQAYPDLEDVIVEYKQYMMGSPAGQGKDLPERHSIRNSGGVIPCDNSLCNNGGFEVDLRIPEVLSSSDDKPKSMKCSGHEKMGRGQTRSCLSFISYKLRPIPKRKA